jgi:predicted nucleotidyltransferase component of viral defense system
MSTLSEIRDAFQQRLLTFLFRGPESSSLVLKGGGAMRVRTDSARYTQGLDFDHDPHRSLASLQKAIRSAIDRALKGSGLAEASVSEPKQTDTVARWKVSARTGLGVMLQLTVEVSRRTRPDPEHIVSIPIQVSDLTLPRVYVTVYDDQALASQKLAAILDERRTAVRDLYDLELLLARGVCPAVDIIESLGGGECVSKAVATKLDLMNWAMFRDQVLPTLPPEIQSHIDEDEYREMKLRLLSALALCISIRPGSGTRQ